MANLTNDTYDFHDTFQPQLEYIAKVLELAANGYSGTKHDISAMTGIPTGEQRGKVEPHIKYAQYMGLISYSSEGPKKNALYFLHTTQLGAEIYAQDKYMLEDLTKWICHFQLSNKYSGAPQWKFIFHGLPFIFDEPISNSFIVAKAQEHFANNTSLSVVRGSYSENMTDGCFSSLGIVDWNKAGLIFHETMFRHELLYLYGYALMNNWESALNTNKLSQEITITEMRDELGLMNSFCLNDDEMNNTLDELAAERIIAINRQLFPATIIKLEKAENLISHLFENLL